jgi:hypothetical protein
VRLEAASDGRMVLRWKPNPKGRKPVKYRIYGSDEKGFSISDEAYRVRVGATQELAPLFPANFVAETPHTELIVLGAGLDLPNANKAFYRVVAVDAEDRRSGPSDYAGAPRPFIYSRPPESARVGQPYRYSMSTIRSLGDLRVGRGGQEEQQSRAGFWDIEKVRYALVEGPAWLRLDERTGVLSGVPDASGTVDVVVTVTPERTVRRLDDSRLSWGHELVKEVVTESVGSAKQRFRITVER